MFAGDTFTVDQRRGIKRALEEAESGSGLAFHVHVGATDGDARANAVALLQRMPDPAHSVVLLVDPGQRALEVVTGSAARNQLSDSECGLAALAMQGSFAAGDLPGGLISGIQQLGEHARQPRSLHTETREAPRLASGSSVRGAPRASGSSVREAHRPSGSSVRDPR